MDILILVTVILCLVVLVIIAVKVMTSGGGGSEADVRAFERKLSDENRQLRQEVTAGFQNSISSLGGMLGESQRTASDSQRQSFETMSKNLSERITGLEGRFESLEKSNAQSLSDIRAYMDKEIKELREENTSGLNSVRRTVGEELDSKLKNEFKQIRETLESNLKLIREDNNQKLETIQNAVNEKLDQRLNESFKQVSEQLEQVYKGLGEMQTIASGVGDLKRVLSNVKTRGIMGEIQLGAILSEILAPEQYETEAAVNPAGKERVEFAVKLPGEGEGTIYLPIDSKFPGDRYYALQEAYDSGSRELVERAKKTLFDEVKRCAKDIKEKYIVPPHTTSFAIMFLPFEGLYAEVVNSNMVEILQREFSVNVAGPSTMAALLNSLQMGFKTLAIQKRSNEVWQVLSAVKSEFGTFAEALKKTQKQLQTAENSLESLVGTRTRAIERKLSAVEALPTDNSSTILGLADTSDELPEGE